MLRLIPTLFLRWVTPSDVYRKYRDGVFSKLSPDLTKLKVNSASITQELYNGGESNERYNIITRDGTRLVVYTTNCKSFNTDKIEKDGFRCGYCSHLNTSGRKPAFIITSIKEGVEVFIENEVGVARRVLYFRGERPHCDFNCALSTSIEEVRRYNSSVQKNIRRLHRLCYPHSGTLLPALDKLLYEGNLGPLSYEEYKSERNEVYVDAIGVIVQQTKHQCPKI